MIDRPGILRYTLTRHFQDTGIVNDNWFVAVTPVLVRAVARATGKVRLPSKETDLEYLNRYAVEQQIRELDPTEFIPEVKPPEYRKSFREINWQIETYRQDHKPTTSTRWKLLRQYVFKRDGRRCAKCGAEGDRMHIDHIKPKSRYPQIMWDVDNLQVLCPACNIAKYVDDGPDYRKAA